jgi:excisionase family DNA binding protein
MEIWLTIGQVARGLGLQKRTVRRLIAVGKLPAIKLSQSQQGRLRVKESDLTAYQEKVKNENQQA